MTARNRRGLPPGRRTRAAGWRAASAMCITMLIAAAPALRAQDTGLSKSELVRLVVSNAADSEKVATVRSRCLSFEPTEGDWRDLRGLGADEALVSAAQECARAAQASPSSTARLLEIFEIANTVAFQNGR